MSAPTTSGLELHGVQVRVGGRTLLQPLDLVVEAGSWTCIVGPNGAGKSTLLRAVVGLVRHEGTITIAEALDGPGPGQQRRLDPRRWARLVALVPQHPTMPAGTSVAEYVSLGRTPHIPVLGTESATDRAIVTGLLARLDLVELAGRELSTLSGGERQRTVIARALAQAAPILVLDEPTTGLDLGHQQQVLGVVDDLRTERGLTVISAMHDLTLAAQHADQFLLLDRGRVVARGPALEVFDPTLLGQVFGATVTVLDDDGELVVVPSRRPPADFGG